MSVSSVRHCWFLLDCCCSDTLDRVDAAECSQSLCMQVLGAALYVGFRSAKFALYKPAEEMVYKKLDERAQTEGKASVDVVAAQMGKTGSSLSVQLLLLMPMFQTMGVLSVAFLTVCTAWRGSLTTLSEKMDEVEHTRATAAELAADAVEWGEGKASEWGETAPDRETGDSGAMYTDGVRGSRQVWGSDDGPRESGVRCGAFDPVPA